MRGRKTIWPAVAGRRAVRDTEDLVHPADDRGLNEAGGVLDILVDVVEHGENFSRRDVDLLRDVANAKTGTRRFVELDVAHRDNPFSALPNGLVGVSLGGGLLHEATGDYAARPAGPREMAAM